LAQETGVSYGSRRWALKEHFHVHPYKIPSAHGLKERTNVKRVEYCQWFGDVIIANEEDILDTAFFAGEAWFYLSDYVNGQDSRVCPATNPHEMKVTPLHDHKVGVWPAVSRNRIIRPTFFDDTINSERYREVIRYPFIGHLNEDETARGYFKQGGATVHTARVSSMALRRDVFGDRITSKDIWPPRSPELTPPGYYLWAATKGSVYKGNPHTLLELKEAIANFIRNIL
jgi:hypothetical protein